MTADKNWRELYLRLQREAALKRLEDFFVYHTGRDELYEIDEKAESFLASCNGTKRGKNLTEESEFVEYCLEEGILEILDKPNEIKTEVNVSPTPSLRYLELQLTERCNLRCRHCYLGNSGKRDMELKTALGITEEFNSLGGLRLLISGGEPLLYSRLTRFLKEISSLKIRRVLLTNGTLINRKNIRMLDVEEIQFSLDGWESGHEKLRGRGSFAKTIEGIKTAVAAGKQVSLATMIHRGNLNDFERMKDFAMEIGAREWGIDIMCVAGNLRENAGLVVPYEKAAGYMKYSYGGGYHGSSDGYACGRHLLTILPRGTAVKCGFYDKSLGNAGESLEKCWLNLEHIKLDEMNYKSCPVVSECCGGCRFRAADMFDVDPAMCAVHGIDPNRL
jgi:radical SAM protein with 4Fe4S-binding SPASM domain